MSSIGNRIKSRRKELGLTVDEIAEKLGKNRATVYRYENDDIENLPLSILEPLAKELDTTPAYLMGWETDADNSSPLTNILLNKKEPLTEIEKGFLKNKLTANLEFGIQERALVLEFQKLNDDGKRKALERIEELTYIPKYTKEMPDYLKTVAAHERTDEEVTEEKIKHDDDLMNNDKYWK